MSETSNTGLLTNNANHIEMNGYISTDAEKTAVSDFTDGYGYSILVTEENQLLVNIGPFKGKDLSKLMTFVLVWTNNIPEGIEDQITLKHFVDGVEDLEDEIIITKNVLSVKHGDSLPYYFDPYKTHEIKIYANAVAVGYIISFDYVQFNTMNINQVNSSTLAATTNKPFVPVEDYASPIITFSNVNVVTVSIPFNTAFIEPPSVIAQCISSYFTVDLDIYEDYFDLTVATGDLEVYTGDVLVNWIARGLTVAPYQTQIVEFESQ